MNEYKYIIFIFVSSLSACESINMDTHSNCVYAIDFYLVSDNRPIIQFISKLIFALFKSTGDVNMTKQSFISTDYSFCWTKIDFYVNICVAFFSSILVSQCCAYLSLFSDHNARINRICKCMGNWYLSRIRWRRNRVEERDVIVVAGWRWVVEEAKTK